MRFSAFSFLAIALCGQLLPAGPLQAGQIWRRTGTNAAEVVWTERAEARHVAKRIDRLLSPTLPHGIAKFGPFLVLDKTHASLVGATDTASPRRFIEMLHAYPAVRVLEMFDCPGTYDDTANLRLGRMIRARAFTTEIPAGGSVRSGAVELFLAGAKRHAASNADFGVHAWRDDAGRGPADFSANNFVNRNYIDYYRAMGMKRGSATAFYALTNSAPNNSVLWLHTSDLARFMPLN